MAEGLPDRPYPVGRVVLVLLSPGWVLALAQTIRHPRPLDVGFLIYFTAALTVAWRLKPVLVTRSGVRLPGLLRPRFIRWRDVDDVVVVRDWTGVVVSGKERSLPWVPREDQALIRDYLLAARNAAHRPPQ